MTSVRALDIDEAYDDPLEELIMLPSPRRRNVTGDTLGNDDKRSNFDRSTICNVVLKIIVDVAERHYFEEVWHIDIYESMSLWKGFLYRSTNVINVENGKVEYVTIIAFDNLNNLRAWITSGTRKRHMDDARAHNMMLFYINEFGGSVFDDACVDTNIHQLKVSSYNIITQNDMAKAVYVPRPPPKWKLFFIIWGGVYLAVLLTEFSGLGGLMAAAGLPLYMIILFSLGHSVTCLSFTFFPLLMSTNTVSAWLKAPRPPPEKLSNIMWFLDLGLDMFSEERAADPSEILRRIQKLEVYVEKLKKINYDMSDEIVFLKSMRSNHEGSNRANLESGMEEGRSCIPFDIPDIDENRPTSTRLIKDPVGQSLRKLKLGGDSTQSLGSTPVKTKAPFLKKLKQTSASFSRGFSRKDLMNESYLVAGGAEDITVKNSNKIELSSGQRNHPLTMSVLNRVKWECTIAFENWLKDMVAEMSTHAGFLGMTTIQVPNEDNAYINTFSFDNYEHLELFIASKKRKELLKRLEGMLLGTSVSEVNEEQSFAAVFDELFVSTGGAASLAHPPVWKTTLLVIAPLFFLVWCIASSLNPVLLFEVGLPQELVNFIGTAITVFVNSYFGVPVMHMFFGKWHRRHRKLINRDDSVLSFLDLGLSKKWQVIVLAVYVALLLCLGFGLFV